MDKLRLFINGTIYYSNANVSVLYNVIQFADKINIRIPRFCYHDQLSIVGNCRMCLIESGTAAKPILACSTEVSPELEIYTDSILVKQAREQMIEFLLINHPLDCPICDQGGECDLQDLTYAYGSDRSRYVEDKRGVSPFYFGPLIKVVMTRCIQCTRCIRFFDEIAGSTLIGSNGRGTSNTISPYLPINTLLYTYNMSSINTLSTDIEIIGNVADICPVGALTIRPGSYLLRAWEIVTTETLDVLDSLCSNIRIDTCGSSIVRVLPRLNSSLNDEWITDKVRFCATGLSHSRVLVPTINLCDVARFITGIGSTQTGIDSISSISWEFAFFYISYAFTFQLLYNNLDDAMHSFFAYIGGLHDAFSIYMFKLACGVLGLSQVNTHINMDVDFRSRYLFTDSLSNVFDCHNVLFLLAINVRKESPILNIRIQNSSYRRKTLYDIFYIGTHMFTKYHISHIGISSLSLFHFAKGRTSVINMNAACLIGRTFNNLNTVEHGMFVNQLFGSVHNLCLSSGDIHIRELCTLQSYNVRNRYVCYDSLFQ